MLLGLGGLGQGLKHDDVARALWRRCGGPFDDVAQLIDVLLLLNLASRERDTIKRTRAGDRIARAVSRGEFPVLGITLIRAGFFHDQARVLIETGRVGEDGRLRCRVGAVQKVAAQLFGLLALWPSVQLSQSILVVPPDLLSELTSVWALLPPPAEIPAFALERKRVGDRAEMYSVQAERSRAIDPSLIAWVARESDTLGWDVEDRSITPYRCIEVKGRRDEDVIFYLSENEWKQAQELGPRYEVHFWGSIDLGRDPALEYAALRAEGYPLVLKDMASQLAGGRWIATATRWRIISSGVGAPTVTEA